MSYVTVINEDEKKYQVTSFSGINNREAFAHNGCIYVKISLLKVEDLGLINAINMETFSPVYFDSEEIVQIVDCAAITYNLKVV